jgi:hypothetical protein
VKTELSNLATDNFAPLASLDWQVHIYDEATPEIRAECDARTLKMHIFPWREGMRQSGLRRNAIYLVRPDGDVALSDADGKPGAVTSYLDARKLTPRRLQIS